MIVSAGVLSNSLDRRLSGNSDLLKKFMFDLKSLTVTGILTPFGKSSIAVYLKKGKPHQTLMAIWQILLINSMLS